MQQQSILDPSWTRSVQSAAGPVTIVFDGPNSSGKSARGELMSESTGFGFFDTGAKLRQMKEVGQLPEEVIKCMAECGYVPDSFIKSMLRDFVYHEPSRSKILVGVRTVDQLHDLFLNSYNFKHRIIHVRLQRKKSDCMRLAFGRGREDANPDDFNTRWELYQNHSGHIQSFLDSRPAIRQIRYRLTDDIHEDCMSLLRLIEPHCPQIQLPIETISQ